jgi:FKBP-type peptidyl-prolyl cis-trans isomerase FkpA
MIHRRFHLPLAALLLLLMAGTSLAQEVKLETEDERKLYALGLAISSRIPKFNPTDAEIDVIVAGLRDGFKGKEPRVDMAEYSKQLDPFLQARMVKLSEAEMAAGATFREEAARQPGAVKSESGVIFIEVEAGSGEQPGDAQTVKVHYKGTLRDGTVFDSSYDRGEPAEFRVDSVVPCFAEGLKKMKVGGKARLVCPAETAYGNRGTPRIPPGATLAFEVELIEIVKP